MAAVARKSFPTHVGMNPLTGKAHSAWAERFCREVGGQREGMKNGAAAVEYFELIILLDEESPSQFPPNENYGDQL